MMMILGMFVFSLPTATYQQLARSNTWRHASNSRVGDAPAYQFVGRGEDTITLDGSIMPGFKGSALSLTALRVMADTGKAWPLISGHGTIYGLWIIESLTETQTYFFKDGKAQKIEFTLTLKKTQATGQLINNVLGSLGATGVLGTVGSIAEKFLK